jgi:hypothetical protein
MAATVSVTFGPEVPGNRKVIHGTVTFDSSYPTGGEAISLADLGLGRLDWLETISTDGYLPAWDGSTSAPKIKMFRQNETTGALAEVASAVNLSTAVVRFRATGA